MTDLTSSMMEVSQNRDLHVTRFIGRNAIDDKIIWVMSDMVQIKSNGELGMTKDTPFMWLRRLNNGTNVLLQESLACKVVDSR